MNLNILNTRVNGKECEISDSDTKEICSAVVMNNDQCMCDNTQT